MVMFDIDWEYVFEGVGEEFCFVYVNYVECCFYVEIDFG